MTEAPRSFDAKEAGEIIGKSENWMKTKARAGTIPCSKIGRDWRWTSEHLSEILRMSEQRPKSSALPAPRSSGTRQDDGTVPLLRSKPPRRKPKAA